MSALRANPTPAPTGLRPTARRPRPQSRSPPSASAPVETAPSTGPSLAPRLARRLAPRLIRHRRTHPFPPPRYASVPTVSRSPTGRSRCWMRVTIRPSRVHRTPSLPRPTPRRRRGVRSCRRHGQRPEPQRRGRWRGRPEQQPQPQREQGRRQGWRQPHRHQRWRSEPERQQRRWPGGQRAGRGQPPPAAPAQGPRGSGWPAGRGRRAARGHRPRVRGGRRHRCRWLPRHP